MFTFYLSQGMVLAWSRVLGKELHNNSRVCELHFDQKDIIRCENTKNWKGGKILKPEKLTRLVSSKVLPKVGECLYNLGNIHELTF